MAVVSVLALIQVAKSSTALSLTIVTELARLITQGQLLQTALSGVMQAVKCMDGQPFLTPSLKADSLETVT